MSRDNKTIAFTESKHHVIDPTNPRRALNDGVEHRLHIRRRAADNAEHFGRRRLMLQSLAQFCIALLQFLKQPNVLDRNNRWSAKVLRRAICFVRERTNLCVGGLK